MRNGFGDVELAVRGRWVVVELGGSTRKLGRMLGAEVVLDARTTTMRRDRLRLLFAGLFVPRECLVLSGVEPSGPVTVTVVPRKSFQELWAALVLAGVEIEATGGG